MKNVHGFSYFKDMAKFWSVLLEHLVERIYSISDEWHDDKTKYVFFSG